MNKTVTFDDAFSMVQDTPAIVACIEFSYKGLDNELHRVVSDIESLYYDWMDECIYCPENDAHLESLTIALEDCTLDIDEKDLETITFEDLMCEIENTWEFS
jgi:hypothetical protein